MGNRRTRTTSRETAVTTPNLSPAISGAVDNYYGQLGGLLANPTGAITPANSLQQGAWGAAQALGQNTEGLLTLPRQTLNEAQNSLGRIEPVTAQTAALPTAYTPQTAAMPGKLNVQQAAMPTAYKPVSVGGVNYGPIAQATVAQGAAPDTPAASMLDPNAVFGDLSAQGYGGADIKPYIEQFQNPYQQQVVDATLADLTNQQGIDRARYAAQGAKSGAFGGSRFGIGETNLIDSQGRTRATTQANLLSQMYQQALEAATAQAGLKNSAGIASMQSANSLAGERAGLLTQLARGNQDATNDFRMAGFDAAKDFGLANLNAENTANIANAGFLRDASSDVFRAANSNARQDATAQNTALGQFYDTQAEQNRFDAGQANNAATTVWNGTLDNNQFIAGEQNDALSQFYDTTARLNQSNANELNQTSQFNQNLALDKANALGAIGTQQAGLAKQNYDMMTNNISLLGDAGNDMYNFQSQYSPYSYMNAIGGLLDPSLIGATTGQTINSNGTSTSKESGGLLGDLVKIVATAGANAAFASERRVKRDIVKLGEEADGLGVYRYNYVWDDEAEMPRFGVMVDEVERLRPWALGPVVDGIQTVDYSKLETL